MVQGFSVVSLFKINLMPGGNENEEPITKADIEKVKRLVSIEAVEPQFDNISSLVERENEFCEIYKNEVAP